MTEDYNKGFTNGLSVGIALNGKIIQPSASSNIWKYVKDKVTLTNLSLTDGASAFIPSAAKSTLTDSVAFEVLSLSDSVSVQFV